MNYEEYPDEYTRFKQPSGVEKSEWFSSTIVTWYKKFLNGYINRERSGASNNGYGHGLVTLNFLQELELYLKILGSNINKYKKIFSTDYGPEGKLKKIYEKACQNCSIQPSCDLHVVVPVKWLVYYDHTTNEIVIR